MPTVSHSEADAWLLCQRKWLYGYGWNLTNKVHGTALSRGTAGHRVLEEFYSEYLRTGDGSASYSAAMMILDELKAAGNTGDDGKATPLATILDYYFNNEPFVSKGYEILAVEQDFTIEYDDEGNAYPFVVDLIVRDPQGRIAVVDHKFQYDFLTEQDVALQPQIKKYIGAIRALGLPADYGIYNQLRYRSKKELTAADVVRQHELHPTPQTVTRVFLEQVETAGRINEFKQLSKDEQNEAAVRVGNKMVCRSCSFKDLCIEDMRGGNINVLIEADYQQKERRSFKPSKLPEESEEG